MPIFDIIFFFIALSFAYTGLSLAPWVPTKKTDLERINQIAQLKKGEKFLEIGCGDAKVCHFIAKNNPFVQVVGVELSPIMFFFAKSRNFISPQKNLTILFKDLYKVNFSPYDVIYVFGLPESMSFKIKKKFETEGKAGAKLLSYAFEIKDWKGTFTKDKEPGKLAIYSYEIA